MSYKKEVALIIRRGIGEIKFLIGPVPLLCILDKRDRHYTMALF